MSSNIIIGTAGHIDHGKTSLIRKLTGIETDRWKEEKKRGITIDLGFAYFDLPSGKRAGIIDVPGHEKFIKNMLAGASGVDVVLLIISAEEGIMPQTKEHLDILSMLDVKNGIVVLTKADLVDEDWLILVEEEVREGLKGSVVEDAKIIPVSSMTGAGIDELTAEIDRLVETVEPKKTYESTRFPIDRSFSATGFGTIVTGTLSEGKINLGDTFEIYPKGIITKVRKIQVHGEDVETAYAGQRVAVNITGVKKDDVHRGDVLAPEGELTTAHMIDAKITLLDDYPRELENWTRLRFYQGTKEALCRMVLLDREVLKPGEECFVQLRMEEKIVVKYGDKFVLRYYSPLETVGGGIILDPNAHKHKRFKEEVLDQLVSKSEGDKGSVVEATLKKLSASLPKIEEIISNSGISSDIVKEKMDILIDNQIAFKFGKMYMHIATLEEKEEELLRYLNSYHTKHSLRVGVGKEEVRNKILKNAPQRNFDEILKYFEEKDLIKIQGTFVSIKNFEVNFSVEEQKKADKILGFYKKAEFTIPNLKDVLKEISLTEKDKTILDVLVAQEKLVKIEEFLYIHKECLDMAQERIIKYLKENEKIALGEFRDLIGTSRKVAVPILEYFDNIKLTIRVEDKRALK